MPQKKLENLLFSTIFPVEIKIIIFKEFLGAP